LVWIRGKFGDFAPECGEIMDGVDIAEAAGVDNTHEEITDLGSFFCFIGAAGTDL
jgi:hypothetical protein